MTAKRDLTVYRDDDYAHEIAFTQADETALDVSGYTFAAQIRHGSDTAIDFTIDDSDNVNGIILLTLDRADTVTLHGVSRWDLQATLISSGFVETWLAGAVVARGDVTREGS